MNYPIAIEHEPGKAYGVQVPDFPGCFSAGDTLDEAISNAAEALAFHIEGLLDAGDALGLLAVVDFVLMRRYATTDPPELDRDDEGKPVPAVGY